MGLGSGKQVIATAPPLKDVMYRPVANLRLTLFNGSSFLAPCYKWKVQAVVLVLGLFVVCFLVVGFFFLIFLFSPPPGGGGISKGQQ